MLLLVQAQQRCVRPGTSCSLAYINIHAHMRTHALLLCARAGRPSWQCWPCWQQQAPVSALPCSAGACGLAGCAPLPRRRCRCTPCGRPAGSHARAHGPCPHRALGPPLHTPAHRLPLTISSLCPPFSTRGAARHHHRLPSAAARAHGHPGAAAHGHAAGPGGAPARGDAGGVWGGHAHHERAQGVHVLGVGWRCTRRVLRAPAAGNVL